MHSIVNKEQTSNSAISFAFVVIDFFIVYMKSLKASIYDAAEISVILTNLKLTIIMS